MDDNMQELIDLVRDHKGIENQIQKMIENKCEVESATLLRVVQGNHYEFLSLNWKKLNRLEYK